MKVMEKNIILQNAKEVRLLIREEYENHRFKMSETRLDMAVNATNVLCEWINKGGFYHNDGSLGFSFSHLKNSNMINLFLSLGVLLGIYKGIPRSRKITRILEKIQNDLFKAVA